MNNDVIGLTETDKDILTCGFRSRSGARCGCHRRKNHNLCVLHVRVVYLRLGVVSKSAPVAASHRCSGVVRTWTASNGHRIVPSRPLLRTNHFGGVIYWVG